MRIRLKLLVTLTALSLSLTTNLFAQFDDFNRRFSQDFNYNWDFYGGGARALAMGNAYTAVSSDVFSLGWNPAGIANQAEEEIYLGFDWSAYSPKGSFDFNSSRALEHGGSTNNFFRNFALTSPANISQRPFVLGIGLTRIFDTYDLFAEEIFPHPTSTETPDVTFERRGYLNSANIGAAIHLSDKLSAGVAANVYFGRVIVEHNRAETYANQAVNQGQLIDGRLLVNELDSFNLSGLNFNVGLLYDVNDETSLGLSLRTPFKMKLSNDVIIDREALGNGAAVPGGAGGFTGVRIFSDRESKVEIPFIGTLGLARTWSDKLLTSLDLDLRSYSSSKFFILDSTRISPAGNKESFFHDEEPSWNSVLQVRFGAEWKLNSHLGEIPIRAGFGYLPQPFSDVSDYHFEYSGRSFPIMPIGAGIDDSVFGNAQVAVLANQDIDLFLDKTGSQITAISFSLGAGIESPQRSVNIAYSFTSFTQSLHTTQAQVLDSTFDVLSAADPTPFLVKTERSSTSRIRDHRVMISFTGFF